MYNKYKGGGKEGKAKWMDIKLDSDMAEECRAENPIPFLWVCQQHYYKLLSISA